MNRQQKTLLNSCLVYLRYGKIIKKLKYLYSNLQANNDYLTKYTTVYNTHYRKQTLKKQEMISDAQPPGMISDTPLGLEDPSPHVTHVMLP